MSPGGCAHDLRSADLYPTPRDRGRIRGALCQTAALTGETLETRGLGDLVVAQEAEIMTPAPFMRALGSRNYGTGNVYEMRT
jgi:hypothetical protein